MKVVYLVLLILVVIFLLYVYMNSIPKIIWTYWNEDPVPKFIERCIDTWRTKNKGFEIVVLNDKNLKYYLDESEYDYIKNWKFNDSPQKMSDLVRLSILSKYGGVWMDASIVCYQSIETVIPNSHKCTVYSIPELSEEPLIESWFIACNRTNKFIREWKNEFFNVDRYSSPHEYADVINVDMKGITNADYLLIYLCARKVLRENPDALNILNATTGPYSYHVKGGVRTLCDHRPDKILKLRKEDRAEVMRNPKIEECVFA